MKRIRQIFLIGMILVVLFGCATKTIRKECRSSSYELCLRQFTNEEQRKGMTKAEFKTCWRIEYAKCCRDRGVEPW